MDTRVWNDPVAMGCVYSTQTLFFLRKKWKRTQFRNRTILLVLLFHTQSDKRSALMSLLLNPVVHPSRRLQIWGQFSPRWWVCSGMLCLFVSDWPPKALRDSDSATSVVPGKFLNRGQRNFYVTATLVQCFQNTAILPPRAYVCAADPFQWEASSCFCCKLHNSIIHLANECKQKKIGWAGQSTDRARVWILRVSRIS